MPALNRQSAGENRDAFSRGLSATLVGCRIRVAQLPMQLLLRRDAIVAKSFAVEWKQRGGLLGECECDHNRRGKEVNGRFRLEPRKE